MPLAVWGGDEVTVEMSLSQDVVSLGGQTYLIISVSGSEQNLPEPQLPNLTMFDAYPQGTSTNISIVNGKMQTSLTYNYLLTPRQKGTFVIRPAVVSYNHKQYESNEVTLRVIGTAESETTEPEQGSSTQDGKPRDVFLTAELDKKSAYVNEQLILSVKFYSAVKLYSNPDYTAPQTTDFWADMLKPQKTYYQVVNNTRYRVIEINTALFPTRSGDLTIGPAMVTASVPGQRRARRNDPFSVFDDFFDRGEKTSVRSKPILIKIKPLPDEGKPANFSGTVGNYKLSSTVDKKTVEVNQAVNVTYKISGTGNIKTIAEPVIGELADFRVYRTSSPEEKVSKVGGVIGGTKIFEEVYMPKRAGQLVIPGVELNFFDPQKRKYQSISTEPITLNVKPATQAEYADIPITPVPGRLVDPNARDIRYIKTDMTHLNRARPILLFRPYFLAINIAPILMLAIVWISRRRSEKLAGDVAYARSRRAKKMSRRRLKSARQSAGAGEPAKFYSEIRLALFSYIADKKNISPHGLTGDQVMDILNSSGAGEELIGLVSKLLKQADFAQYSSSGVSRTDIDQSLDLAEQVLIRLEGIKLG
jgi:hypothetical protein